MEKQPHERFHIEVIAVGSFECSNNQPLLNSLEQANINIHHACREGFCGACRSKLLEGSVDYTTDPLAFIDDDEFLPCCSVPKSPLKIKVSL